MRMKINAILWQMTIMVMATIFWVNIVAAQEEVEAAEEASSNAPAFIILLAGLAAVAVLGFMMSRNSGNRTNGN